MDVLWKMGISGAGGSASNSLGDPEAAPLPSGLSFPRGELQMAAAQPKHGSHDFQEKSISPVSVPPASPELCQLLFQESSPL